MDGRLLAFALTFKREGTLSYYVPAFDPDYARYAPSATLLAHLIETACGEGFGELDFMLGDEPYKAQWASGSRSTSRLVIGAPSVAGRLALAGFGRYLVGRERARHSAAIQQVRRYGWRGVREIVGKWVGSVGLVAARFTEVRMRHGVILNAAQDLKSLLAERLDVVGCGSSHPTTGGIRGREEVGGNRRVDSPAHRDASSALEPAAGLFGPPHRQVQ